MFDSEWLAVTCAVLYWYNTNPEEIMKGLFPTAVDNYLREREEMYKKGFTEFWGTLDFEHQQRFIALADEKYKDEACRKLLMRKEVESLRAEHAEA
jgi:hypothetical protein